MPLQPPDPATTRRVGDGFVRDDATVLSVAHTLEQAVGGFPTPQPMTAGRSS
jgi:hypothetical protein